MYRTLLAILLPLPVFAQPALMPVQLAELAPDLSEASALLYVQGATWTLVDGPGQPEILELDPNTGQVLRTLGLINAMRTDWEALAMDDTHVYVGDIGNNNGDRQDLRIFRFPVDSLLDPAVQTVMVETIAYSYADQTVFTPAPFATPFDCEAMILVDGEIVLFTKRWNDEQSRVYRMPAQPGTWTAQPDTLFDSDGLVTDATRDPMTGDVFLAGYRFALPFQPFVWVLKGTSGADLFQGSTERYPLTTVDLQLEGCAWAGGDSLLLVNEEFQGVSAACWSLHVPTATVLPETPTTPGPHAWPNPFGHELRISLAGGAGGTLQVSDHMGRTFHVGPVPADGRVDTSHWPEGPCLLEVVSGGVRHRLRMVHVR